MSGPSYSGLYFDIYAAATPLGSRLVRLTNQVYLDGTTFRVEYNGTGSGQIVINAAQAECTEANFAKGNYVRVVYADGVCSGETLGGFFLMEGDFQTLSAKEGGGRNLRFGGPGALSYLSRAVVWNHSYVGSSVDDPTLTPRTDGQFHFPTSRPGPILDRFLREATDGDRPQAPLPDLTWDFDSSDDSASSAWGTDYTDDFTVAIGTGYIDLLVNIIKTGISVRMTGGLLMQAFDGDYGTDRHSASFGAGKVRLLAGTNIAADLSRAIRQSAEVSHLLVQGDGTDPADMQAVHETTYPYVQEGFLNYGPTLDAGGLSAVGEQQLVLRKAMTDTATCPIVPGNDPTNGYYTPGFPGGSGHFWVGDTVTLHTGTGEWDYNELSIRVAAIQWILNPSNGVWTPQVELGSTYIPLSGPNGSIVGTSVLPTSQGCTCPPPAIACLADEGGAVIIDWNWGSGIEPTLVTEPCATGPASSNWGAGLDSGGTPPGSYTVLNHDNGTRSFPVTAGDHLTVEATIWQFNNDPIMEVRWYDSGCTLLATDILYCGVIGAGWTTLAGSGVAPAGAICASVRMMTGGSTCTPAVGFSGYVQRLTVTGASTSDPLCGAGAYSTDIINYGPTYVQGAGPGYIPAGSTLPPPQASEVPYVNTTSGLSATDVQDAIDEIAGRDAGCLHLGHRRWR